MASPSQRRRRRRGWQITTAAWRAWSTPARVVAGAAVSLAAAASGSLCVTALAGDSTMTAAVGGALFGIGLVASVAAVALLVHGVRITKRLPRPDWRSGSLVESALDDEDVVTADPMIIEDLRRTAEISLRSAPLVLLGETTSLAAAGLLLSAVAMLGGSPVALLPLVLPLLSGVLVVQSTAVAAGRADAVMRALRAGEVQHPGEEQGRGAEN